MERLAGFLFFYLEAYAVFLMLYVAVKLFRKIKMPYGLLVLNLFALALCFYVRQRMAGGAWVFAGSYARSGIRGEALANPVFLASNVAIAFIFFCYFTGGVLGHLSESRQAYA